MATVLTLEAYSSHFVLMTSVTNTITCIPWAASNVIQYTTQKKTNQKYEFNTAKIEIV